jgi:hypothetical protein
MEIAGKPAIFLIFETNPYLLLSKPIKEGQKYSPGIDVMIIAL